MNKFQEVGAGLVLLFGGDGPAAQRAGDALLADRIGEAVEEGGFTSIDYGAWRKAEDALGRLEFDDVRLVRGPGSVSVARAEMEVFSQALAFEDGAFAWTGDPPNWRFDRVEIERGGFLDRSLRISAHGLEPEPPVVAGPCGALHAARCALEAVGQGRVAHFHMLFRSRDRDAVLLLAWQEGSACWLAWTGAGRGSADLASWGRAFLADPGRVEFRLAATPCDLAPAGAAPALAGREDDARDAAPVDGDALLAAAPVLARTLFGLVAESYAYLLE